MLPAGAPRSYDIATLDVSFISVLKVRNVFFSSFLKFRVFFVLLLLLSRSNLSHLFTFSSH